MSIGEIIDLKDGTRVILTQIGTEWGEDCGSSGVCVKIGNRLVEADINRPDDSNIWYPYYSILELNDKGYECDVKLEFDICVDYCESTNCKGCKYNE